VNAAVLRDPRSGADARHAVEPLDAHADGVIKIILEP